VGSDDAEPGRRQRFDLLPPAVPELRKAVQQDDERPVSGLDVMQLYVADVGVAVTNVAAQECCRLWFRDRAGIPAGMVGCAHCALPLGMVLDDGNAFLGVTCSAQHRKSVQCALAAPYPAILRAPSAQRAAPTTMRSRSLREGEGRVVQRTRRKNAVTSSTN